VPDGNKGAEAPIRIKKYANRRLYNTATSTYVTLEDLAVMVKDGADFEVNDAKSGEDITRSVLTQIIFEQENKGQNLLPINFLRQLIRFYGDSMQVLVPTYLEVSLKQLAGQQDRLRRQLSEAFGTPFEIIEEQARKNMAMFTDAFAMFSPIAGAGDPPAAGQEKHTKDSDIAALKDQLAAMQAQINRLTGDRGKG
jgi:polyhydroxyalkanoate synthesis repressor PhaR